VILVLINFAIKGMSMNDTVNGVRGEVSEYTWGRMWADGTKEFNNGALQYADGSLEFDGLTFYPDGVVIDATGQQVGLTTGEQAVLPDGEPVDEVLEDAQSTVDEEAAPDVLEKEDDTLSQTGEGEELITEDESDTQYYMPVGIDER